MLSSMFLAGGFASHDCLCIANLLLFASSSGLSMISLGFEGAPIDRHLVSVTSRLFCKYLTSINPINLFQEVFALCASQELRKLEAIVGFTQLRDEEIEASAAKLGLLPASAPPPHRSPLEDLGKGYSKFRRPIGSASSTFEQGKGMLGLKRKRWQLERDISIGLLPTKWPSAVKRHHEDCLSGTVLPRNETPSHYSVDGASMTSQLTPPVVRQRCVLLS